MDRRRLDRRESPSGHLRNAVQVLLSLSTHPHLDDDAFELIVGATRRIMLALWELERK